MAATSIAEPGARTPFLERGFRPFFLGAGLFAALALPLWLVAFAAGWMPSSPLAPTAWHGHEMVFGYLAAVIAGFLLTAIPNWTGRLPVAGAPLAGLALLWLAGRLAMAFGAALGTAAAVIDAAFLLVFAAVVAREVLSGRNWRNAPICALLTLFALGNVAFHVAAAGVDLAGAPLRGALAVAAMLIALIGGRIVPSFTRNWLMKRATPLPAPFGRLDRVALALAGLALLAWVAAPEAPASGAALVAAGLLHAVRLARWQGRRTWREPLLLVLHVGYGWLAGAFLLLGLKVLLPGVAGLGAALHALTAGAIGTMTVAVMTRASLGHAGRPLTAGGATVAIYLLINAGALLRVAQPALPLDPAVALIVAGGLWSAGYLLFAVAYGPLLLGLIRVNR